MEGGWRVAPLVGAVLASVAFAVGGCGSSEGKPEPGTVQTKSPERTFAPLVQLHERERWQPMGARWFIERSSLWFAEDQGCEDRKIAVGRTLPEQRNARIDWIFVKSLGHDPPYSRAPLDGTCEDYEFERNAFSYRQSRPHATADGRVKGLRPSEGFYLDLTDSQRRGQPKDSEVPVSVERVPAQVAGKDGLRLTYWLLYGMNAASRNGRADASRTHEGDWERVDVLLRRGSGQDEYVPVSIRLETDGGSRKVPWRKLAKTGDGRSSTRTHPTLRARRGSHELETDEDCSQCRRWETWRIVDDLRKEPWYGYGGAWGEPGATRETSGPLGPHGEWRPNPL